MKTIMVTGGCGFIGSAFVLRLARDPGLRIVNLDCLTYAGNAENLASLGENPNYLHLAVDITDAQAVKSAFDTHAPDALVNFAAETHVDRSILAPRAFLETNIMGTFTLLDAARAWLERRGTMGRDFRFLHVSTDEVYGSLELDDAAFTESTPYSPNSPYAASKAASDHLVRAYGHTYGLPILLTNCSNNYGPRQFPEKLIPFMIVRALAGASLPIYGDGGNIRDWLYVDDHCEAIWEVLLRGAPGSTYNVGGGQELTNKELVAGLCASLDALRPRAGGGSYASQIEFVKDRPGHDRRYAIDSRRIHADLGWSPRTDFATGLGTTVRWYLDNPGWIERITSGAYRNWVHANYVAARA